MKRKEKPKQQEQPQVTMSILFNMLDGDELPTTAKN